MPRNRKPIPNNRRNSLKAVGLRKMLKKGKATKILKLKVILYFRIQSFTGNGSL